MILQSFSQSVRGKVQACRDLEPLVGGNMRRAIYCTILAAMWGGGMTLVVTYLLDFIDGAPRLNHLFWVGGMVAAFSTVALAEKVAELLGISRKARAPAPRQALATQLLPASIALTRDRSRPSLRKISNSSDEPNALQRASAQRKRSSIESARLTCTAAGPGSGIQEMSSAARDPVIRIARGKLVELLEAVKSAESERLGSQSPPPLAPAQGGGGMHRTQ